MTPILLFDGECHICTRIAHWIEKSAQRPPGIIVQAIGQDPAALHALNPTLNIWDAYATPHVLMPDGSMQQGGNAIAEVFRRLPNTKWFAGIFTLKVFGTRPFQTLLNAAYIVLADIRPLLGCDSCGGPRPWVKPLLWLVHRAKALAGRPHKVPAPPHLTPRRKPTPSRP